MLSILSNVLRKHHFFLGGTDTVRTFDSAPRVHFKYKVCITAFELAAEVVMTGNALPDQKSKILEKLVTKMSIETQFAAKVIERLDK